MRALISAHNKEGLVDFARGLLALGVELYSTGGTEELLHNAGLAVHPVQELTGFPEMLGGRVKTLHPAIHAGILARRNLESDMGDLEQHGFGTIDIVVCNLYPFIETMQNPTTTRDIAVENIDIGGITLLRAAAKNFADVVVVCDPDDYQRVIDEMRAPAGVNEDTRQRLAAKAFDHCAVYDSCIASYFRAHDEIFPDEYTLALQKVTGLRYGENPHQLAAFYRDLSTPGLPTGIGVAEQLNGIPLSYNNTLDVDIAWGVVTDFSAAPTVAIVQHANPCGIACDVTLAEAFRHALECDPSAAYGGGVALNREVDRETAEELANVFFEDIVAPSYTPDALEVLSHKQELRVLRTATPSSNGGRVGGGVDLDYKRVSGGFLVQTRDAIPENAFSRHVVTTRHPTLEEVTSLLFSWRAVKHVRSHAIVLAKKLAVVGIGAGQVSRVDAVDIACRKAGERAAGSVMASDAFFPFTDGIERAAEAGVTAVIQPGGSIRDAQVIEAANRAGMAMIFTHQRHFRH